MTQEKRFGLSAVQKSDMWRRWKAGQSLHEIGAMPRGLVCRIHAQENRPDSKRYPGSCR
jgi:hypothetical protein